jgi:hypothetical protein
MSSQSQFASYELNKTYNGFRAIGNNDCIMSISDGKGKVIGKAIVFAKDVEGELRWFVSSYKSNHGNSILVNKSNAGIYKADSIKCLIEVLKNNHPDSTTDSTTDITTDKSDKMTSLYGNLYTPNI